MKLSPFLLAPLLCSLLLSATAPAQPLPKIKLQPVFPKLQMDRPVWMSEAPDGSGRYFVVGQAGKILVVKKGSDGSDAKEFMNIEDRHPYFENEDGLLSMAFHPDFRSNGLFYIYYNRENDKSQHKEPLNFPFCSVISEFKVSATDADKADMNSERFVIEVQQPFWNHKGGEIAFGPDGYLYFALGDGGNGGDPFGSGQNPSTLLAKMLRIDVNTRATVGRDTEKRRLQYGFPPDNPYVNEPDIGMASVRHEIYACGLRNVWRFSFDRENGALWGGDVGQDLWEEVDLIVKGGNYGWSVREGAHHFKPGPPGAQYVEPVLEYPHNASLLPQSLFPDHGTGACVVGGYVYRGKQFPALDGVYIYADFVVGTIWGLRYDYTAHKVVTDGELLKQPKNITSFAEDLDGEVYALTMDGHIYLITAP